MKTRIFAALGIERCCFDRVVKTALVLQVIQLLPNSRLLFYVLRMSLVACVRRFKWEGSLVGWAKTQKPGLNRRQPGLQLR
jgi:hypothetical protein